MIERANEPYQFNRIEWLQSGQNRTVETLLQHSAVFDSKNKGGNTPLLLAAENDHLKVTKLLIEKGADVNSQDNEGNTPLHKAVYGAFDEIVHLLIEKGADVHIKSKSLKEPCDLIDDGGKYFNGFNFY